MAADLTLLIPGLMGPAATLQGAGKIIPRLPALEKLLACASITQSSEADYSAQLSALFKITGASALPVAAITHYADSEELGQHAWLRADPVHLVADLDRVILLDSRALDIQPEEAEQLVDEFNEHFAGEGFELVALHPERWYLKLVTTPAIRTYPPFRASGRDIKFYLPRGADAKRWSAVLNETQMLFHTSMVNRVREQNGSPTINGLWLWGEGDLSAGIPSAKDLTVFADEPLVRGIAKLAHCRVTPLPENGEEYLRLYAHQGRHMLVIDDILAPASYDDAAEWCVALEGLESQWMNPLLQALKQRRLASLQIYPCNGRCFDLKPHSLWKFWRRRRTLEKHA